MTTRREKILFVDDDIQLRTIVTDQLHAAGYEVDVAGDGLAAMDKITENRYDLLLLDITMPGKSGLDVLKSARQLRPDCRAIVLTGVVGLAVAIESLKLGASDYVTKPYNIEYLLSSIRRTLSPT